MRALFCIVALLVVGFASAAPQHALTTPALASELQAAVHQAIQAKQIPGAVILVLHQGQVLHHAAYGHRALVPQAEPMTTDTLFDMASMTKPIATVTCIMKLYEQGKLQLTDKASQHLPSFQGHGKEAITIAQLLLHVGGLIADNAQEDFEHGYEEALRRIDALKLQASPGTRFIYSDIGYIVLGRIVEKLTGKPLDQVAQEWVFTPLGM
ncbi:MAG TPA: serine hydrolase domain-containing protein, partial [Gemmatales bacterium]|nr:serine hydrolase domain-containing protein [Gemmatales bacterium]